MGVDLLDWRVEAARHNCPAGLSLECGNAERLRLSDQFFDIIVQATVFSSIINSDMKRKVALEMVHVLKPEGLIIW